jgi:AraC-like DNA-binding protein
MSDMATQEQARLWRAHDLGGLELLRATYTKHEFARHSHPEFMVGVIEQGGCAFYYRGGIHTAPAGSIVLINPGEAHDGSGGAALGLTYRAFYPSEALLQQIAADIADRQCGIPYFPQPVIQDAALAPLVQHLHMLLESQAPLLERESHFLWAFAQLISSHTERRPALARLKVEHLAVQQARDYLAAHHAESVSLGTLAALAQLSPYHFLRVFRAQMGLPPHAYLTQLRIASARRLVAQGMPLSHVALAVGFVDQSHLTRHFKRLVGVTPAQYLLGSRR